MKELLLILLFPLGVICTPQPSFTINYANNSFSKNGQFFQYISGSLHFFRVPPYYWKDRLLKMKAAGLNTVQTYIPWNMMQPKPGGNISLDGFSNITYFLDLVKDLDFVAIIRAGPYISSEWENGGLPWWLLKNPNIKLRTRDPAFLAAVENYYNKLFPILVPYLWKNNGPIAGFHVENEYGSFSACDIVYKAYLRDLFHSYLGNDTLLFTTDGPSIDYLRCGFIPGVYPTIDNYASASAFQAERTYAPRGPLINSEFYPGWFDAWGSNYSSRGADTNGMRYMWSVNASFNFYIFQGGTNFGYMNGAGSLPITTSYQFDAPLSEAGDPTDKYYTIRQTIKSMTGWNVPGPVPPPTPKAAYGKIAVHLLGTVAQLLGHLSLPTVSSKYPLSMEDIDFPYGYVVYETVIPANLSGRRNLTGSGVKDRGYVMVDGEYQGRLIFQFGNIQNRSLMINAGSKLQILVENMGRTVESYVDRKGIIANVTLDGITLTGWNIYPIDLEKAFGFGKIRKSAKATNSTTFSPSIYYGEFEVTDLADTYFDPSGWGKGQFLINNFNVGRYWPSLGPQVTLYTPKPNLEKTNRVVLLELEAPGNCDDANLTKCWINFRDSPFLNKTVKPWNPTSNGVTTHIPLLNYNNLFALASVIAKRLML